MSTFIYVDIHFRETYSPTEAALKQISMYFFIVISMKVFKQAITLLWNNQPLGMA